MKKNNRRYPSISQYKNAIVESESFSKLENGISAVFEENNPVFASGNFATVFKMVRGNKYYALKCFLKCVDGRDYRQKEISKYLRENPSKYLVEFSYLEDELWVDVDGGTEYSVSWMKWVDAPTLGEKIEEYVKSRNKKGLLDLAKSFKEMSLWLIDQPFAHGDLKHDNIIVKRNGELVLVDYDGLYLPTFKGGESNELGGKSYQHPKRTPSLFNQNLDDFSILIIYISLLALSNKPSLFSKYSNGQNIIFDGKDFESPRTSSLFKELSKMDSLTSLLRVLKQSLKNKTNKISSLKTTLTPKLNVLKGNLEKEEYLKLQKELKASIDFIKKRESKLKQKETLNEKLEAKIRAKDLKIKRREEDVSVAKRNVRIEIAALKRNTKLFLKKVSDFDQRKSTIEKNEEELIQHKNKFYEEKIHLVKENKNLHIEIKNLKTKVSEIEKNNMRYSSNVLWYIFSIVIFFIVFGLITLFPLKVKKDEVVSQVKTTEVSPDVKHYSSEKNSVELIQPELKIENTTSKHEPIGSKIRLKKLTVEWWNELSIKWKNIFYNYFKDDLRIPQTSVYRLSEEDIRLILFEIENIKKLWLIDKGISDITPLTHCVNLTFLNLYLNNITDIRALSNLKQIDTLYLSNNPLKDIRPLANLINLRRLDLRRDKISDVSPLRGLKKLRKLDLYGNPIEDFTVLGSINNLRID